MQQLWTDIVNLVTTPFVADIDLTHLFLLVGLVLIFIVMWAMILRYIQLAGEAVKEI